MKDADIKAAVAASNQFTARARAVLKERAGECPVISTRASGALRRASLELTRALADLRHPYRERVAP